MYRWGNRESHSYVLGAWDNYDLAAEAADAEYYHRGAGKYVAEIVCCDGGEVTTMVGIPEGKAAEEWCASERLNNLTTDIIAACSLIPQGNAGKKLLEDALGIGELSA
jgi:hypothetical protein